MISDLHLGEDLSPTASAADRRHVDLVERNLVEFLRHYARRRLDGRPWRLVVNGDMVDFLGICLMPADAADEVSAEAPAEDRVYGLGRRPEVSCAKMQAVLDRHSDFFREMARFLAAGNAVDIVIGNHDTELQWPEVQEVLRRGIAGHWDASAGAARPGALTGRQVADRMSFHPWFYYEPGGVWIEHGHQYDECCSFEFGLNPVDPRTGQIITNVDAAALRYITAHNHDAEAHGSEDWSFGGYLRFAFGLGARGMARMIKSYYRFSATLINVWRGHASLSRANRTRRELHRSRLRRLAEHSGLDLHTLAALDEMRRPPVPTHLPRLLKVLMLDRIAIAATTALLMLLAFLLLPFGAALLASLLVVAGAGVATRILQRGRLVDPSVPLGIMPTRILRKVDARYVVFGHSHNPVAEPVAGDRWYFNTGTWLPTGKPGLLRAFTHVVVRQGAHGPSAALCQWRDGASREFTPGWAPKLEPAPIVRGEPEVQVA